jgi:hypothetical protein
VNAPDSIVAAQLRALLDRLEQDRERRCAAELASARERARAIARAARSEARHRMGEATRYERMRIAESLTLRRAELEAAQRREQHAALRELVKRACDRLPAALERRWKESAARREWCETTLVAAARRLGASDWAIEIAPGSSREERDGLLARAGALRTGTHTLREHRELSAGLSVRAAGATLDATVTGLLDDLAAIEGRFLRECVHDAARAGDGAAQA